MNKTVMLIRNVMPENYGGGESYQLLLAHELREHGFVPIIISSSNKLLKESKKRSFKNIRAPFCKRQNWSGWRNILLPVYYMWQIRLYFWYRKQFRKYEPGTVNIQSRDDWIAATLAAKKCGIKVLWTDHIDFRTWVLKNVNAKYKNFIGKWILRLSNIPSKIIMISDNEFAEFKKIVPSSNLKNVLVIKNGVMDRKEDYKNVEVEPDSFCYVGRLVDYKGITELIQAFKNIDGGVLNIYGDGDLEKYKRFAGGNKSIRFHGFTDDPLMAMAKNEVFILPSYYEGLSIALIEAAMMGKTIISTDVDGNPEVVQDSETGILVPAKNSNALADAMKKILDHKKEAKKMGENARAFYEGNFNFDKIFVEKMLVLYNEEKEKK